MIPTYYLVQFADFNHMYEMSTWHVLRFYNHSMQIVNIFIRLIFYSYIFLCVSNSQQIEARMLKYWKIITIYISFEKNDKVMVDATRDSLELIQFQCN